MYVAIIYFFFHPLPILGQISILTTLEQPSKIWIQKIVYSPAIVLVSWPTK